MREIKFRGISTRTNQFVYGDLLTKDVHHGFVIVENGCVIYKVIPETVGQYTGIKDRKGQEIYFGDIMIFADKVEWYRGEYGPKVFIGTMSNEEALAEINAKPYEERNVASIEDYEWLLMSEIQEYWEVIGNIHQPAKTDQP